MADIKHKYILKYKFEGGIDIKNILIHTAWKTLHLADKCLLIIMAILMIQTAHNLFFREIAMQESNVIDAVIRTTTAAIFGYFISVNFHIGSKSTLGNNSINISTEEIESSLDSNIYPKAKIGFTADLVDQELNIGKTRGFEKSKLEGDNQVQIIIVATIGITSLILFLIARNYTVVNVTSIATLSQLRDFISGSVGFLISQSTGHKKSS